MTTNSLCRTDLLSKETQTSFSDSFGFIYDFLKERHPKLVPNLYHVNQDVILTRRLGTKRPVVSTKWPWPLLFCGSPDYRLLFILACVPRVVQKSASTNLLRLYMIKPTLRKTAMASNTKNMEVCDRHARHRSGTYKCTFYTNLPLEGKVGSFNAT